MLSTRTEVGEIGVLANHTPLLAMLQPSDLRLHLSESEVKHFAQGEGYLQVHGNHALVLVEDCFEPEQIDRAEQEERLRKAEAVIDEAKTPADLASARCPAGPARQAPRGDVPAHRRRRHRVAHLTRSPCRPRGGRRRRGARTGVPCWISSPDLPGSPRGHAGACHVETDVLGHRHGRYPFGAGCSASAEAAGHCGGRVEVAIGQGHVGASTGVPQCHIGANCPSEQGSATKSRRPGKPSTLRGTASPVGAQYYDGVLREYRRW